MNPFRELTLEDARLVSDALFDAHQNQTMRSFRLAGVNQPKIDRLSSLHAQVYYHMKELEDAGTIREIVEGDIFS